METGWITTEVGRQPFIVYGVLRTADAVSPAPGLALGFFAVAAIYAVLTVLTVLRAAPPRPLARRGGAAGARGGAVTLAEVVLGIMFVGLIAYALFGGADFGAGIWDLLAGGTRRGAPQRAVIEHAIGPVWEANHVWLIFVLVVLWTGFPAGFTPVASTLYVPLTLAAFGMIARGAAFAFRKSITTLPHAPLPRRGVRGVVAGHAVLPGRGRRRRRVRAGAAGHRDRRRRDELGQPHLGARRRARRADLRLPRRRLPLPRRAARRSPRARGRVPAAGRWAPPRSPAWSGSRASSCCGPTRRSSRTGCSGARCPWWRCPCSRVWRRSCCW